MPPYYPKAKNDLQKLKINKDKPAVSMIEKDAPIVDSPVSIDFEEMNPGGPPQDVRAFAFTLTLHLNFSLVFTFFCLLIGSNRTSLVWYIRRAMVYVRTPPASSAGVNWVFTRRMSYQITITFPRVFNI